MMPVVDPGVGLSQNHFSVADYLSEIKQFHVLRMVAVQQQQSTKELKFFQMQAETPGLVGFPNAIVASANLLNPEAVASLVKDDALANMRGISHCIEAHGQLSDQSDWQQSLVLLAEKNLCLDLMAVEASDTIIAQMALFKPELNIIVNLSSAAHSQFQRSMEKMSHLAEFDNVYLKIGGIDSSIVEAVSTNTVLYDDAFELFGFDRVMFSSGVDRHSAKGAFDQMWSQYVEACSNLSARHRDSLFRMNAIRVYRL